MQGYPWVIAKGNGAQSEFQALALKRVCGIEEVRLYDTDPQATDKCAKNLAGSGLTVVPCQSSEEAIAGAQIITTCTADKQYATILTENLVGSGVHINAIGGDCPDNPRDLYGMVLRERLRMESPETVLAMHSS